MMRIHLSGKSKTVLACGIILLILGIGAHYYWLDGLSGAFFELTIGRTTFARGYREFKFRRIVPGMTGDQLRALMPQPLRVKTSKKPGEEIWFYTNPRVWDENGVGANWPYSVRNVFLKNGVVTLKYHEFYFD